MWEEGGRGDRQTGRQTEKKMRLASFARDTNLLKPVLPAIHFHDYALVSQTLR